MQTSNDSDEEPIDEYIILVAANGPYGDRKFQKFLLSENEIYSRGSFIANNEDIAESDDFRPFAEAMMNLKLFDPFGGDPQQK